MKLIKIITINILSIFFWGYLNAQSSYNQEEKEQHVELDKFTSNKIQIGFSVKPNIRSISELSNDKKLLKKSSLN